MCPVLSVLCLLVADGTRDGALSEYLDSANIAKEGCSSMALQNTVDSSRVELLTVLRFDFGSDAAVSPMMEIIQECEKLSGGWRLARRSEPALAHSCECLCVWRPCCTSRWRENRGSRT